MIGRFFVHKESKGVYQVTGEVNMKDPSTREWVKAFIYSPVELNAMVLMDVKYCREKSDFLQKFSLIENVNELIKAEENGMVNRKCINCEWFEFKNKEERLFDDELIGYCKNDKLWEGIYKRITVEDFGCNHFKRTYNNAEKKEISKTDLKKC